MLKKEYTAQEWTDRENFYKDNLTAIALPVYPDGNALQVYVSKLDVIMSEATIDKGYIYQAYEYYNNLMKLAEKELTYDFKVREVSKGNKPTVGDIEGLVTKYLKSTPLPNTNLPIYDIVGVLQSRKIYIDSVLMLIKSKIECLCTSNTVLSAEVKVQTFGSVSQANTKRQ